MRAERARRLARLALIYHVTPADLRACTFRELEAMERLALEVDRKRKRKGGS